MTVPSKATGLAPSGPSWSPENLIPTILSSLTSGFYNHFLSNPKAPPSPSPVMGPLGGQPVPAQGYSPSWSPENVLGDLIGGTANHVFSGGVVPGSRLDIAARAAGDSGDESAGLSMNPETKQRAQRAADQTNPTKTPDEASPADDDIGSAIGGQVDNTDVNVPKPASRVPTAPIPRSDAIKAAMLQAGLSLMTPQWGGPLSQIGQAAGAGAEAYTRAKEFPQQEESVELKNAQERAKTAETLSHADYYETATKNAKKDASKDRSTDQERLYQAMGIGPKGRAYMTTRLKSIGDVTDTDSALPPQERFAKIIREAQGLDTAQPNGAVGGQPNETVTAKENTTKPGDVVTYQGKQYKFNGGDRYDRKNYTLVK